MDQIYLNMLINTHMRVVITFWNKLLCRIQNPPVSATANIGVHLSSCIHIQGKRSVTNWWRTCFQFNVLLKCVIFISWPLFSWSSSLRYFKLKVILYIIISPYSYLLRHKENYSVILITNLTTNWHVQSRLLVWCVI